MSLTSAQKEAIAARGNVLVVAGAGTGKTSTLVERCLACLVNETPPASLDEILMVTFTDAAAAEMRRRIREGLEKELAAHPGSVHWPEQLALFENAHIGTLHSFCLRLVRQHFYELELDPQLSVLPEEETRLLAGETLDDILQEHYSGKSDSANAVQQLIQTQGGGWDVPIRDLVLRLHNYTQTLRDPAGWFDSQLAAFESPDPAQWRSWLLDAARDWRDRWFAALRTDYRENPKAAECAAILQGLPENPTREQFAAVFEQIANADLDWPSRRKGELKKPIEDFFEESTFLDSLARTNGDDDPLTEDWNWVRSQMAALLGLAREFTNKFSDAKRELGMVDFHDLEQHSLRLLWDEETKQHSNIAREWRAKLRFVFVDEYQDINEAQDTILKALSREEAGANRFLVGDVKQSIYRFRLADPRIFQQYVESWSGKHGQSIPLTDNFRSREALLNFVNSLFGSLMRREIGGVPYDDKARLRFGDPENRAALGIVTDASPCVELLLRVKGGEVAAAPDDDENGTPAELLNLEEAGKEARLVALRLRELKAAGHLVWDKKLNRNRPVEWSDMAVLLRSPSGRAETFAREFARLGVPLMVARGGFYKSVEVADLLNLLHILDNPLQDLPLIAVLHSPLVGMSADELAAVRLALPKARFWSALQRYHDSPAESTGWSKADRFLKNFTAWRRLARQVSLSRCLETVLGTTHYAAWLLTQSRGEQRHANVQRFLTLAQHFDQFQRQGLFRFLRFIEAQQAAETEPDVAIVSGGNCVSLMSIHQSKGLEFPVVAAADLGRQFNLMDLRAEIILDEKYGLCPQIEPPHGGRRYPSLTYWLARQRQRRESLGEELRLLYVAMTRARDLLILSGSISERKLEAHRDETAGLGTRALLGAKSYMDWIAAWAVNTEGAYPSAPAGDGAGWRWTVYDEMDRRLMDDATGAEVEASSDASESLDAAGLQALHHRLAWKYPHEPATHEPAKTSVTALRRRLADEEDDEATTLLKFERRGPRFKIQSDAAKTAGKMSAIEIGMAHHRFLQLISLERADTANELRQEAQRLESEGKLTAQEAAQLDLAALAAFWQTDPGKQIRACHEHARRELAFTARFSPRELAEAGVKLRALPDDEFVVVQGVADLAVFLPGEIWLVDFKTDEVAPSELAERAKPYETQLHLYARAFEKIYGLPVTKAWLHFLSLRRSVPLQHPASATTAPGKA